MDELEKRLRAAASATRRKAAESLDLDDELTATQRRAVRTTIGASEAADRQRRVWLGLVAAAAIVATVAGASLVSRREDRITTAEPGISPAATDATATPPTPAEALPVASVPPETAALTTTVPTPSTAAATATATSVPAPAGVSYLDPPPDVGLRSLGAVSVPTGEVGGYSVAVGDLGVAVGTWHYGSGDFDRIEVVGFDGIARQLDLQPRLGAIIAYGPGDVIYTTRQAEAIEDFAVVAVPLTGDRAGTVVSTALANINEFVELPYAAFGHGERGIVQRDRDVGATVIEYVDIEGRPTSLDGAVPPFFTADTALRLDDLAGRIESSAGVAWQIDVEASPDRANPYVGPSPPAAGAGGIGVYWTHIGPDLRPAVDFGEESMWVIARLSPDGSTTWWSIPDGWRVVASDMWGTVLAKQDGEQLQLAMAEFS